jgi:hypothetical protein
LSNGLDMFGEQKSAKGAIMIQVTCTCGATMQVQDDTAGKQCKCPKCGAICQIPAAPEIVAPTAPTPAPAPAAPAAPSVAAPVASKRPGGLTALAVLNFVFGGLAILFGLGGIACGTAVSTSGSALQELGRATGEVALQAARDQAEKSGDTETVKRIDKDIERLRSSSSSAPSLGAMYYTITLMVLAIGAFLIVAGVGYLKQSRKSGYVFGNIYGIAGIIVVVLQMAMLGAGLGFGIIIGLAYPIVTLALLNTVFKESFPNP